MNINRVNSGAYIYILLCILLSTITCNSSMVCESDTTIAAGSTVTIGGSETITVASGKKLVVEGTLEIAPYVPGGGTVIIDIGFVED